MAGGPGTNLAQKLINLDRKLLEELEERGPGDVGDGSAMGFEQKRRLSIALGQLPADRLGEVVRIVAERHRDFNPVRTVTPFCRHSILGMSVFLSCMYVCGQIIL